MEEGQNEQGAVTGPQWQFQPDEGTSVPAAPQAAAASSTEVSWTASEYIAHQKNTGWYVLLGLGAVAAAVVVFLLTRDKISSGMVVVVAVMFGIFAARQPRVLAYQVTQGGVKIGEKFFQYGDFKSFSVLDEGHISSILLMPLKRFMPGVSMYYPPEQEEKIVNVLVNYLPHEERQPDFIDRLMRKVRF